MSAFDSAKWISGPAYSYGASDADYYKDNPNHVLTCRFTAGECRLAQLRVAVLGYARLLLNGQPVTADELLGDWTNPTKVVYYDTFDVTDLLCEGENELVAELGNGWYNPSPLTMFGKYNLRERLAEVGTPSVLLELVADGRQVVASDESWQCREGNVLFNNVYLGETVELGRVGKALPVHATPNARNLEPAVVERCCRFDAVEPRTMRVLEDASILVDFGVLNTGVLDISFEGKAGTEVTIRYAEELNGDGMPLFSSSYAGLVGERVPEGFTIPGGPGAPLKALQCDRIRSIDGLNRFTNVFSVHSCRYAGIVGVAPADIVHITFTPVHTDLVATGHIETGEAFFDQLVDAAVRTKLNNVHGVWEDCARERLGYGGDMVALAASNLMAFDCERLIRKTVRDFRNDQTAAGGVPETAPFVGIGSNGTAPGEGPLLWQLAYPHLVLRAYQFYGARDLVESEWPYVKRLVDYLMSWEPAELAGHCLGDHGSVQTSESFKSGTPDKEFVGWCTIARFARAAARFEQILGLPDSGYAARFEELRSEIRTRFAREDGTFGDGTQTGICFAADLGLGDERELADLLVRRIGEDDGVLATGIFGTTIAFDLLHRTGHSDVVEKWLTREKAPSFKAMLSSGNGALAEQFKTFLSSYNHAMFSSYLQWFYQGLAGIRIADDAVACDRVEIRPYFSELTDHVTCSFDTPRGTISCEWTRANGEVTYSYTVPEGVVVL